MINKKRYLIGNLVRINGKVHKIVAITETEVTAKNLESGDLSVYNYDMINPIPLSDSFFKYNGYEFDENDKYKEDYARRITHIIPGDGIGPSITKYEYEPWYRQDTEYCVTGIIIRTVDEFQNLMNICHCSFIADTINCK